MTDDSCGLETITVEVQGDTADGYEGLVGKAMSRAKEFLPTALIHRHASGYDPSALTDDQWFVSCAHSSVSAGGSGISGTFVFQRFLPV